MLEHRVAKMKLNKETKLFSDTQEKRACSRRLYEAEQNSVRIEIMFI